MMSNTRTIFTISLLFALTSWVDHVDANTSRGTTRDWSLEIIGTFDLLANLRGGRKRGIDIPSTLEIVGDYFWGDADNANAHHIKLNLLGTAGGNFSADRIGDIQTVSSVEAPNSAKLFEAWYEYTFGAKRASLRVGLQDLNAEFYVLERASSLLHSSFGIGPEIAQANASLFPTTALGAVVRIRPNDKTYVAAGIYDGFPGSPTDKFGTHIRFDDGDGLFAIGEVGYVDAAHELPAKAAIGVWHTTASFEDIAGVTRGGNSGAYVITELPLTKIRADGNLGLFLQFGFARASRNEVGRYFGGGLHWIAPFAGREEDEFSAGVAHARLSNTHRQPNGLRRRAETAIELSYAYQLNDWLVVQPDIQFVIDPGSHDEIDDAVTTGIRIVVQLP
jgi:porin